MLPCGRDGCLFGADVCLACEADKWLCETFRLKPDDVIRHYDVTGKNCPRYFVEHEDAWAAFLNDLTKEEPEEAS